MIVARTTVMQIFLILVVLVFALPLLLYASPIILYLTPLLVIGVFISWVIGSDGNSSGTVGH